VSDGVSVNDIAAVLLTGGRGSRMGGVVKPLLEVGGATLLDAAITAARSAGCDPIVGVGDPIGEPGGIAWVREDPPFGGPAAAILAALPLVTASRTLVLACDLPEIGAAVELLRGAVPDTDGVCLTDASGRPQWLTGLYRTDAIRAAGAALSGQGRDAPARALLGGLSIAKVAASDDLTADVDTWDDLNKARRRNR